MRLSSVYIRLIKSVHRTSCAWSQQLRFPIFDTASWHAHDGLGPRGPRGTMTWQSYFTKWEFCMHIVLSSYLSALTVLVRCLLLFCSHLQDDSQSFFRVSWLEHNQKNERESSRRCEQNNSKRSAETVKADEYELATNLTVAEVQCIQASHGMPKQGGHKQKTMHTSEKPCTS